MTRPIAIAAIGALTIGTVVAGGSDSGDSQSAGSEQEKNDKQATKTPSSSDDGPEQKAVSSNVEGSTPHLAKELSGIVGKKRPEPSQDAAGCLEVSDAERKVLLKLRARHEELEAQRRALEQREQAVKEAEQRIHALINRAMERIEALENKLQIGAARRKARQERVRLLVDAIEAVSPRKAAPILAQADEELVADLLVQLGSERTGDLLSRMPTAQAAKLMQKVTQRRQAP